MRQVELMLGDNIQSLKKIPDNSIDSIVSDPPYGLSFMNKKWDYDVPSVEFWKEVYRVLKPGGHILSFGGTRTYHRMVVNIEDAGFEIRDQIMWLYGSGFPKSHNIGKAVDKLEGKDVPNATIRECESTLYASGSKLRYDNVEYKAQNEYEGWGTALKPANEPICLARKPLSEKSVAENVLKWGTGGINIDGCRIGNESISSGKSKVVGGGQLNGQNTRVDIEETFTEGRFPANIILDEIAGELLDEQSGVSKSTKSIWKGFSSNNSLDEWKRKSHNKMIDGGFNDKGGASRFFYVAKVSKAERNLGLDGFEEKESVLPGLNTFDNDGNRLRNDGSIIPPLVSKNNHPTVKPVELMTYLCRLITPENGIVLDPFMGSGSTGIAAQIEGFRFVGMEMDADYFKIAEARINNYKEYEKLLTKKKKK